MSLGLFACNDEGKNELQSMFLLEPEGWMHNFRNLDDGILVNSDWSLQLANFDAKRMQTSTFSCIKLFLTAHVYELETFLPHRNSYRIYSIIQLCIFSWQSYVIKWERDKTANRRLPFYGVYESYDYRYLGPDWTKFYVAPEERFFTDVLHFRNWDLQLANMDHPSDKAANEQRIPMLGVWKPEEEHWKPGFELAWMTPNEQRYYSLFVVQILCLISAFFLLFGSVALIYGIHTVISRQLLSSAQPFLLEFEAFDLAMVSMYCGVNSLFNCILRYVVVGVENYWLILTIIESLSVIVNLYVLLCVIIQYRHVLRQREDYAEDQKVPVVVWDDYCQNENFTNTRLGLGTISAEAYWNKTFEEEPKRGNNRVISAQGQADFGKFPLDQPQKREHLWPQDALLMGHPRKVVEESQVERKMKSRSEQQVDEARPVSSMETVPLETVLDGPMKMADVDKSRSFPSPTKRTDGTERSYSVDALATKPEEKNQRSMRSSKSKDSLCSKHRHRSHSHHRHESDDDFDGKRSLGDSRSRLSDTDTGYSESSRRSRHKHKHRSDDERENVYKHGRHRRVRDVKREDKERSDKKSSATSSPSPGQLYHRVPEVPAFGIPVYPSNYSVAYNPAFAGSSDLPITRGDPLFGMPHMFPGYPVSQAFSAAVRPQAQHPGANALREVHVPPTGSVLYTDVGNVQQQQFVIPTSQQQQPHKFQINSEIQISYSDHTQSSRPDSQQSVQQNNSKMQRRTSPNVECSAVPFAVVESERANVAPTTSDSADSKGTGATAV
ncbi:LOW QUALITY PROTEIN: hypothetical protein M513_05830 [Trichuris suis]|uniref:Uncharacterized protein n=1 Tax=Trichuris suis TaxID=68888 RepID=A0A085M803_9BILA|nr:LOW QUALITY PROTEIN: hypothetical protein M513_05830 [Trichuris suis]